MNRKITYGLLALGDLPTTIAVLEKTSSYKALSQVNLRTPAYSRQIIDIAAPPETV